MPTFQDAFIFDALRTPMGKRKGNFAEKRPDDLFADLLIALTKKAKIEPKEIEDVIVGCVTQINEQSWNIARNALLTAGFPVEVCGTTVNRLCGSSQQAIHFAAATIQSGGADLVIAGGVESMTRVPMGSDGYTPSKRFESNFEIVHQGTSAERIAEQWNLSRADLDQFSLDSHLKAIAAIDEGKFKSEIEPITTQDGHLIDTDEGPRRDTSMEVLGSLKSAFSESGKVTAGNASQITDGAAALLMGNEETGKRLGLTPRARIINTAVAGVDPTIMLTGPIPATQKILKKAGLQLSDIQLFEVNEAFASVPLAWQKDIGADPSLINVNGGAIALGHPLGATGARLFTTLLNEMERRQTTYGLVTMCIGFGQATATIIERV